MDNIILAQNGQPAAHNHPAYPTQSVRLADLLRNPSPQRGSYLLGMSDIPILVRPRNHSRIILAAASRNPTGLLALAATAATTATQLKGNSTRVAAITDKPDFWINVTGPQHTFLPIQLPQAASILKTWDTSTQGHLLVILDDIRQEWAVSPVELLGLAETPGINVLATGQPDAIAPLAHAIQSSFLIIGNLSDRSILGSTPPLTKELAANEFAFRHQSKWHIFSTITR